MPKAFFRVLIWVFVAVACTFEIVDSHRLWAEQKVAPEKKGDASITPSAQPAPSDPDALDALRRCGFQTVERLSRKNFFSRREVGTRALNDAELQEILNWWEGSDLKKMLVESCGKCESPEKFLATFNENFSRFIAQEILDDFAVVPSPLAGLCFRQFCLDSLSLAARVPPPTIRSGSVDQAE